MTDCSFLTSKSLNSYFAFQRLFSHKNINSQPFFKGIKTWENGRKFVFYLKNTFFLLEGNLNFNIKPLIELQFENFLWTNRVYFELYWVILSLKKTQHYLYVTLVRPNQSLCLKDSFTQVKGKIVETEEEEEVLLVLKSGHKHRSLNHYKTCVHDFFSLIFLLLAFILYLIVCSLNLWIISSNHHCFYTKSIWESINFKETYSPPSCYLG